MQPASRSNCFCPMTSPELEWKTISAAWRNFYMKWHTILGTDAVLWHGKSNGQFVLWAWILGSNELICSGFVAFFLVQVRLFVLILLYNCFLYELLMQEVRIFEKFARRLPADSTENCKLSKRLEFYVQPGCVPGLRLHALNVQNLNNWHLEVQV